MDFDTYLQQVHGYQEGDRISADKARQLKVQFANAGNVAAAQNANANAIKTSISLEVENAAKKGTPIDARIIEGASNLFNTGQFKEAQSLISDASKNIAETTKQQSEAQQTELENKNLTLQQDKLKAEQTVVDQEKKSIIDQAKVRLAKIKSVRSQDVSDVVGAFEPAARYGRAVAAEMGANWAKENQKLIKDLNFIATDDILEKARKLAPVTGTDLTFLQERVAPQETDNDTIWFDFLDQEAKDLESVIGEFGKTGSTEATPPLTDTQKLKAKTLR
jgi:hypothetical protein